MKDDRICPGVPAVRLRPVTWAVLALTGLAGWGNARYWAGFYARTGAALSLADYACFSQRVSLLPPLVMPLMMFHHALSHTGVYGRRNMYLYSSRNAYWRALCRDALAQALLGSTALTVCSLLPGLVRAGSLPVINWGGAGSLYALMTGGPVQADIPPGLVFGGCWAAADLQLTACLLLYGILECRFRPFASFAAILLLNLAFNSPVRRSLWDWAGLGYGCWAGPFGPAALLAGWLALTVLLYVGGRMAYRKVDVL